MLKNRSAHFRPVGSAAAQDNRRHAVTIIHGAQECRYEIAGRTIEYVRMALGTIFNIPKHAVAFVNGVPTTEEYILQPGDSVHFIHARGSKGLGELLTPAEVTARWTLTQSQYAELLRKGLPRIEFADGTIRHPEIGLDEWFRRGGGSDAPTPMAQRLVINTKDHAVILDGEPIALSDQPHAHFLEALLKANGNWLSSSEICQSVPGLQGSRLDRLRKAMPRKIRVLIKTKAGAGFRLVLEPLA
jgi:hypothetical protein